MYTFERKKLCKLLVLSLFVIFNEVSAGLIWNIADTRKCLHQQKPYFLPPYPVCGLVWDYYFFFCNMRADNWKPTQFCELKSAAKRFVQAHLLVAFLLSKWFQLSDLKSSTLSFCGIGGNISEARDADVHLIMPSARLAVGMTVCKFQVKRRRKDLVSFRMVCARLSLNFIIPARGQITLMKN